MDAKISASEAARTFSELLNRVRYRGDSFTVERGGEPVCRIVPVGGTAGRRIRDLPGILAQAPRPDEGFLDELETLTRNQPEAAGDPWER